MRRSACCRAAVLRCWRPGCCPQPTHAPCLLMQTVLSHFPTSLSVDDYMSRVEVALAGYGFTGDNTIGE